jgi:ADP-ribose pyrophosphatase
MWRDYKPIDYTAQNIVNGPEWADKIGAFGQKFNELNSKVDRRSHMGSYKVFYGIPFNPRGRTGISGRGKLGRWGPNHAADPIVTR